MAKLNVGPQQLADALYSTTEVELQSTLNALPPVMLRQISNMAAAIASSKGH